MQKRTRPRVKPNMLFHAEYRTAAPADGIIFGGFDFQAKIVHDDELPVAKHSVLAV